MNILRHVPSRCILLVCTVPIIILLKLLMQSSTKTPDPPPGIQRPTTADKYPPRILPPKKSMPMAEACLPVNELISIHKEYKQHAPFKGKLYVNMTGKLGNHLFQIVAAVMMKQMLKYDLVLLSDVYPSLFPNLAEELTPQRVTDEDIKNYPVVPHTAWHPLQLASNTATLLLKGNAVFSSHMKNVLYINYEHEGYCKRKVRDLFRFSKALTDLANRFIVGLKEDYRMLHPEAKNIGCVGIHVNRGDLLSHHHYDSELRVPTEKYFHRAIDYFRRKFVYNVIFIVASDDRPWCEKHLIESGVYMSPEENSPEQNLALLTRCQHTIASVGVTSRWVSYLTGGTRVHFSELQTMNDNPSPNPMTQILAFSD